MDLALPRLEQAKDTTFYMWAQEGVESVPCPDLASKPCRSALPGRTFPEAQACISPLQERKGTPHTLLFRLFLLIGKFQLGVIVDGANKDEEVSGQSWDSWMEGGS